LKSVQRRRAAQDDIEAAIHFYLAEASERVALGFTDAVEAAVEAIRHHPDSGSTRIGHESGLSSLRSRRTAGYPYLVFYRVVDDRVEILRVLHTSRDLPKILSELEG
jgi:toxin ParE1/3/4